MASTSDDANYAQWSHADLLKRVTDLEIQLRQHTLSSSSSKQRQQQQSQPTAAAQPPSKLPKHKTAPRKPSKPFDASKYHTRVIALKFAYLGSNYNGFEHHANNTTPLPTVEETLWRALRKTRLIFPDFGAKSSSGNGGQQHQEGIAAAAGTREEVDGWEATRGWHPWNGEERFEEICWDGVEYSKCGRTDRGVSAFGQVVGLRVRSSRPKEKDVANKEHTNDTDDGDAIAEAGDAEAEAESAAPVWDPIKDELPYIQLLNRVLPPDIRVLAWCPHIPPDFSARFNCRERRYRYFFTNPAYMPLPAEAGERAREGWLDLDVMQRAAKKLEGLHDFRNFCKIDASKQITNFERRVFRAGIHEVTLDGSREVVEGQSGKTPDPQLSRHDAAKLYFFEVRGSAFLWHQVRHMVAVLFLVGQGYEKPSLVDDLLDTAANPSCPTYEMASDAPLVLWDCIFPDLDRAAEEDHSIAAGQSQGSYEDAMDWIYVGDEEGGRESSRRTATKIEDGKWGRNGIMDDLWALWRERRIQEVLAGSLMDVVNCSGKSPSKDKALNGVPSAQSIAALGQPSARVFDGSESPSSVGKYVPVMRRKRKDAPEVLNARYAVRKGLSVGDRTTNGVADADE